MHGKRTWATVFLRGEHPARLAFQLNAVQIQNIERKIILSLIIKKKGPLFIHQIYLCLFSCFQLQISILGKCLQPRTLSAPHSAL